MSRPPLHRDADLHRAADYLAILRDTVAELDRLVKDAAADWRPGYQSAWWAALDRLDTLADRLAADIGRRRTA